MKKSMNKKKNKATTWVESVNENVIVITKIVRMMHVNTMMIEGKWNEDINI